jgi:hypothetical protein
MDAQLFILKSGMYADTNALHRSVTKVENLEDQEEDIVADDSPIRDCLPGQSFKPTVAALCLLPCKCYVT